MRRLLVAGVAASALLVFPAEASSKRIGPALEDYFASATVACTADPFCTRAQVKLDGDPMVAPFAGEIRKWRVTQPNGTLWLQVLRRRDNGKYKSVRSGTPHTVTSTSNEVIEFSEDLPLRRGDYVGVATEDFGASSLGLYDAAGQRDCTKGFVPGLGDGESGFPNPDYGGCSDVLLYNAVLRR
jgi:hypothetical protein